MDKYGCFSNDRLEFIIKRPDTPLPWVNYISNGRYHGLVSNTGGGYSFFRSPKDGRITRWRYNSLPIDRPGRYVLIRDKQTGKYWSPTWQPTFTPLDDYQCRHGLYYTIISSKYKGISASVLYFVPNEDDVEIWKIILKNESASTRHFDIFAFVELCLGHALVDLINQPNDQHFNEVYFDQTEEILFATKRYWAKYNGPTVKQANESWDKYAFFTSTLPITGWDGSKNQFIGRWRSEENPIAVEQGQCFNSEITSGDAIAALQSEITLEPGETSEFAILMGVADKSDDLITARKLKAKYQTIQVIDAAFDELKSDWRDYLSHVHVETPDENMNTMLNVWNQYQTAVTFRFSRDASYYHGGLLFGRGYRDSCQDIMGPLIPRPDWVKKRILEMCSYQFSNGSTFHLYNPMSGGGEMTGHSDTPLWLPFAIIQYLKETGDYRLLDTKVKFYDESEATVLTHLFAALDFTLSNLTDRHLAKFGPGDWNDTLDYLGREGRGESVWVTMFLTFILKETIVLCEFLSVEDKIQYYQEKYQTTNDALNTHCWDGEWYIRGTNDHGEIIGSAKNEAGQIFLNTQSWAVISGIADEKRARICMNAVKQHLDTPKGPKILHPAYTSPDPKIGLATRCVPGKKENGAVFNHTVSWSILAECLLGRGDRAFEIYQKALPMNPVIDIDRYEVEPYVYAEYVTSSDHPTFGQASHSWLTGSSAWMLRDGLDYILGVRPEFEGLVVDPCIPSNWKSYLVTRTFRGKMFQISVKNMNGKSKGVKKLVVENIELSGNMIRLNEPKLKQVFEGKDEIQVQVEMG